MASDGEDEASAPGIGEGYVMPITGLLALLFAMMAGATAFRAINAGSLTLAVAPVIFGLVSIYLVWVRQRNAEQMDE